MTTPTVVVVCHGQIETGGYFIKLVIIVGKHKLAMTGWSPRKRGCVRVCVTGGWWHLNWGEGARGNGWSGIGGMVSNKNKHGFYVLYAIPFASSHYCESSSPQQPPLGCVCLCIVCACLCVWKHLQADGKWHGNKMVHFLLFYFYGQRETLRRADDANADSAVTTTVY